MTPSCALVAYLLDQSTMCLFCSTKPLSPHERGRGKYGSAMASYADNQETFDISLCEAPCREPCCCLGSMLCFCPAQLHMRHRALNHIEPGSDWSNYMCCQGSFGGLLCFQPGNMCEGSCPRTCMCLEVCICPGMAVTSTANVIRAHYRLGLDADDVRLIRCNNCLQISSCLCVICAMCTDCEWDDKVACIFDTVADVIFCSTVGCMTAQVHWEIRLREKMATPQREQMERY